MLIQYTAINEFFYGIEDMSTRNKYKGLVEMQNFDEQKLKEYCIKKHSLKTDKDWDLEIKYQIVEKI